MAVVWSDLVAPAGRLDVAVLFPDDYASDLGEARLTGYLADATARATAKAVEAGNVDAYVTAWSYYRAYDAKVDEMAAGAGNAAIVNEESVAWAKDQRDTFKERAAFWLGEADGFVPDTPIDTAPGIPATSTTDIVYTW